MATERFEARVAPAGLALVQELVNTHAVVGGAGDLLADPTGAQEWLHGAAAQWAATHGLQPLPRPTLGHADVEALRSLRTIVDDMLEVPVTERPDSAASTLATSTTRTGVAVVADDEGRVGLLPVGTGSRWMESAVWSEILLAQTTGLWSKLKLCREPGCRSAFYDASRNGSGVWHNVRTCGNVANLRASRARKKMQAANDTHTPRHDE